MHNHVDSVLKTQVNVNDVTVVDATTWTLPTQTLTSFQLSTLIRATGTVGATVSLVAGVLTIKR